MDALLARYPDIEVQLIDGTNDSLLRQLLCPDIDVIAGAPRADGSAAEVRALH